VEGQTLPSTLHEHVAAARRRLAAAGIGAEEADLDARLLAQHVLGWDAADFFREMADPPPARLEPAFEALVQRRASREPMAYILGRQEFWGLLFEVTPDVLIPRPETEGIVEALLERRAERTAPLRIADVGTGSGCLAVALATLYPQAHVTASDVSQPALEVAARNAARHGVADRVSFTRSDLLGDSGSSFDTIVSNPPYIPAGDRLNLAPEVRDHEPAVALFSGPDGMQAITTLVQRAPAHLAGHGLLVVEFGLGQEAQVRAVIDARPGLELLEIRRDLQGIPRTAVAARETLP
jgi:release factor glutamine methyltransferase